jgi:multidrug efflux system outer membrane protein
MRKLITLSLVGLTLAGCMVGPDYRRPVVETPPAWRLTDQEAQETANTAWWRQLEDPVLNDLIATAIRENRDLMIATARVDQFAAQYGVVRADLYPQIGASAAFGQQKVTERGGNSLPSGYHTVTGGQQAVLNASWELDIWGRIRRSSESARADLLASEEGRRGVILSLVSSVAVSYVNLRDLDKQLDISRRTAESRKGSYDLLKLRFEAGIINEMELAQSESEYEQALATIPQIAKSIALQENGLNVLLGRNPGPIPRGKGIDDLKLPVVPAGLPSDLLERRPDIKQAEQNLIAANAQIGVAKAAYYPAISLTGLLGYSSSDFSDLFSGPAKIWQYSAPITLPIFTAGKISAQVKVTEAQQQQALYRYQQTIQTAFREVNDSLADQSLTRQQLEAQQKRVESLRTYAELSRLRFDEGYSSYIEVLDAERSLFDVELSYVQTQALLFQALINLYKAMGGGWVTEAERTAIPPGGASGMETPRPCADEFERFCKDVQPGLGLIIACLDEHRAELSPACRDKVGAALTKVDQAKQDCSADIAAFCADVKPGGGRLLECLKKQENKLAPACRDHVRHYAAPPAVAPGAGK